MKLKIISGSYLDNLEKEVNKFIKDKSVSNLYVTQSQDETIYHIVYSEKSDLPKLKGPRPTKCPPTIL